MKIFVQISIACFLLSVQCIIVLPQTDRTSLLVPKTEILPVVVSQGECPLKVEDFSVIKNANGKYEMLYSVRNTGRKEITSYRIAHWYSDNTGFLQFGVMPAGDKRFQESVVVSSNPSLQSTSTLASGPNSNRLKKIAFIMIVDVSFIDRSSFSADNIFKSLTEHLVPFESIYDY